MVLGLFSLGRGPAPESRDQFTLAMDAVIKTLAAMAMADQDIVDAEIEVIANFCGRLTGKKPTPSQVRDYVDDMEAEGFSLRAFLGGIENELDDRAKEMIIEAACLMIAADGVVDDAESVELVEICRALNMSASRLGQVIDRVKAAHDRNVYYQ